MKTIAVPLIALVCVHLWSCASVTVKETRPDGTVIETTTKGIDPQAGSLAGTAAGVIVSTSSK